MPSDYIVPDEVNLTHKGGALAHMPTPYKGTAPEPRQGSPEMAAALGIQEVTSVDLSANPTVTQVQTTPSPQVFETNIPPSQLGVTPPAQMQVSPPPANPPQTAEVESLRSEVGRLVGALGRVQQESEQRLREMQFSLEAAQIARAPQPQAYALPQGLDPNVSPTWEQLNNVLGYLVPALQSNAQAQAIRATWGVSQEEESQALSQFPVLASIQTEPARTQKILEAVRLLRQKQAPASPPPASVQVVAPPLVTRPGQPTVPHVEHSAAPVLPDSPPLSQMELAVSEYNAAEASIRTARNDAERRERLAALRRATEKIKALQGYTDDMERTMPFRSRG